MAAYIKKYIYVIGGIIVLAVLFSSSIYLQNLMFGGIGAFQEFALENPLLSALSFVALAGLSVLIGPFSSVPLVPFALEAWGIVWTMLLIFIGWMIGDCVSYAIGRYAGKPTVSFFVGRERLERWISALAPRMKFSLLLLFRLAMPAETGYLFGLLAYDFWNYLLIVIIAETPLVGIIVFAGDAFLVSDWFAFSALLLIGIAGIALVFRIFTKRFKSLSDRM